LRGIAGQGVEVNLNSIDPETPCSERRGLRTAALGRQLPRILSAFMKLGTPIKPARFGASKCARVTDVYANGYTGGQTDRQAEVNE